MRVLFTELKKLFSSKIFWLIIGAVFILNGYLVFRTANSKDASPDDYRLVYEAIEGKTDEEKLEWLDEYLVDFSHESEYDLSVCYELREECAKIVGYKDYLESIKTQAETMTKVSIFTKPDTFNYRSIMKTPPKYENVQDVVPVFCVSEGIILATNNNFTDILCGFILLYAVLSIMISDREQGMSGLLFSLKRGRSYLLLMKIFALAITVFTAILLLYTENLIVAGKIYGIGDLSRPVQSLSGFIGCNLKISVSEYLILFILFKFIAVFAVGALLSLIAINTKNTVSFYGISAFILIVEGILYSRIHPLSIFSIFRFINLIAFTKVNNIFCRYQNINFWEYPISLIPASIGAVLIITTVCTVLSTLIYAKKRNLEFRRIVIKMNIGKGQKVHSTMYYALYKSLFQQKGLLIIAFFFIGVGFQNSTFMKKYDVADVYYQYYTNQLEGKITPETQKFMTDEAQRFSELKARLEKIMQTSEGFSAEMNDIQKQLAPSLGFNTLQERYDNIKSTENAEIFYDTGYKRMLGKNGFDDDMKYALMSMLICVFLLSPLIANDNKYKMYMIINSTRSGRKRYIQRNIAIAVIYGIFSAMLWIVPYSVKIDQYYGHSGLNAPLHSIPEFIDFSVNMRLWQYITMIFVFRTISVVGVSLLMLWISSKCRNTTIAVLINFAVFVLPVIIYLLGAKILVNIGFNAILSVNAVITSFSVIQLLFPIIFIIALLCNKFIKIAQ